MASGDRSRTWFPEMVEHLKQQWRTDIGLDQLIALAGVLDAQLQEIRTSRHIEPPVILCPKCGKRGPAAPPRVSVRATIFAAKRFGVADSSEARRLERQWKRHRSEHGLDLYGALGEPG